MGRLWLPFRRRDARRAIARGSRTVVPIISLPRSATSASTKHLPVAFTELPPDTSRRARRGRGDVRHRCGDQIASDSLADTLSDAKPAVSRWGTGWGRFEIDVPRLGSAPLPGWTDSLRLDLSADDAARLDDLATRSVLSTVEHLPDSPQRPAAPGWAFDRFHGHLEVHRAEGMSLAAGYRMETRRAVRVAVGQGALRVHRPAGCRVRWTVRRDAPASRWSSSGSGRCGRGSARARADLR